MAKKGAAEATLAVDFSEGDSLMVDLNEVEDSSFEAMPKGIYPVIVSDCEFGMSQAKGTPMWTLTLELTDGEFAGRKVFSHMVWAGAGLPITKKQIQRIRPDLFEAPFDPRNDEIIQSMFGLEVKVKLDTRMYDGSLRNNVKDLFANEGGDSFV